MRESSPKGRSVGPRPFLYSPLSANVGEVEFCELRHYGALRTSHKARSQKFAPGKCGWHYAAAGQASSEECTLYERLPHQGPCGHRRI
jgi:hypothetical protein